MRFPVSAFATAGLLGCIVSTNVLAGSCELRRAGREDCRVSPADLFLYEDPDGVIPSGDAGLPLFELMAEAANALVADRGDDFDFVLFWTSPPPPQRTAGAFHFSLWNDIQGIGLPLYDHRPQFGVQSSRVQSFLMMYDLHVLRHVDAAGALAHAPLARVSAAAAGEPPSLHRRALGACSGKGFVARRARRTGNKEPGPTA